MCARAAGDHPYPKGPMSQGDTRHSPILLAGALAAVALLGACASSDSTTGVQAPPAQASVACAGSGAAQLGVLQGTTMDCHAGTAVTLAGRGARYLIVPNLAVSDLPDQPVPYVVGASGLSAVAAVAPLASAATVASAPASLLQAWAAAGRGPGDLQRAFDAALRHMAARNVAAGVWRRPVGVAGMRAAVAAGPLPAVGSLRAFHVVSTIDTVNVTFKRVTARLDYVGTNILLYVDTASPPGGFTPSQINTFAQTFDQVLYGIDVNAFGPPSDIDGNGHLIMLLTPVVNALTPAAECASQGYIGGFFTGNDLANTDSTSNRGEIFYALAPDPNGVVSCPHAAQDLEGEEGVTFVHELQHLINFSQHVLVQNSTSEEGWLDEGLSLIAQELGSLYYEQKYPAPAGRSSPLQLFPDSSEPYIGDLLATSYSYLLGPDTTTLTLHSDADMGLNWRGGDWLLLRWLGDQEGGDTFFRALEETPLTGVANIEAAAHASFPSLFGHFSVALYTDSIPGVARSQVPAQDRFLSRDLRRLYAAYYRVAGPSPDVPAVFPLQPASLPVTGTVPGSLQPGAMAFYTATSSASADSITVTFSAPDGTPLAPILGPQLAIFRLQ
jgi:hypothetical protein